MNKINYVCGFCFDKSAIHLALITKEKPAWQKGLLNGIGGKVEETDEDIYEAMSREFFEETGIKIDSSNWTLFCRYEGGDYVVYFLRAFDEAVHNVWATTDENVEIYEASNVDFKKTIPNLKWLIPLALDKNVAHTDCVELTHV